MKVRSQTTHNGQMLRRAWSKAAEFGISLAELIDRLITGHLHKPEVSRVFNLIDEGPPTDIARDKNKMIGEAVWSEYLRDTGGSRPRSFKVLR
jgi:hypothetical protein